MYVFGGEYGCMVRIIPCGMVRYVSEHKENMRTLGSIVERLEALWKRLNAFRAFQERVGPFSWLPQAGQHKTIWYDRVCYVCV